MSCIIDKDELNFRVDEVRERFGELSDFVLTTYDDHEVEKEFWSETCDMISKLNSQLLNLNKSYWENGK